MSISCVAGIHTQNGKWCLCCQLQVDVATTCTLVDYSNLGDALCRLGIEAVLGLQVGESPCGIAVVRTWVCVEDAHIFNIFVLCPL